MSKYEEFGQEFQNLTDSKMKTGTLGNRIMAQKIAYILFMLIGKDFEYTEFSWYLHGVFCWDLWRDMMKFGSPSNATLDSIHLTRLEYIKEDLSNAGLTDYFTNSDDLELITTILYCAKNGNGQKELFEENTSLIANVMALKNKFDEDQIKRAISVTNKVKWDFN